MDKLTTGDDPILPKELESPKIHLNASAMHGLSSIMASVEAEKGTNHLTAAVMKDSYYEEADALEQVLRLIKCMF